MENYSDFINRINSFEQSQFGIDVNSFSPSTTVMKKVDQDNNFSSYFGDTIVFDLSDEEKACIKEIVKMLYTVAPDCFSERLKDGTFHMTLHDLANSSQKEDVSSQMEDNLSKIKAKLRRTPIQDQEIIMKSHFIINMVDTSVVLALCPVNEQEYEKLIALYHFFDEIYKLPYPYIPHITLAYYNSSGFSPESGKKLKAFIETLNILYMDVKLHTKQLFYQRFRSMNEFYTVLKMV